MSDFTVNMPVRYTAAYRAKFASIKDDTRTFYVAAIKDRGNYVPVLTLADAGGKVVSSILAENVEAA